MSSQNCSNARKILIFSLIAYPLFAQLPNPKLTPGAIRTTDAKAICAASFTTRDERHTTASMKRQVCQAYGIKDCPKAGVMELDHLISLELGGADDVKNLWPQLAHYPNAPGFHEKDKLENFLHREVCAGRLTLPAAQKCIADNWIKCYQKSLLSNVKPAIKMCSGLTGDCDPPDR